MKLQELINQSYQTLRQEVQRARVLLLHPASRYRSVLLAKLVNDPDINTYYYALGPDDIMLQNFLESMAHNLTTQHPTFGRHLNMLPPDVYDDIKSNMDIILEAFAKDLNELDTDPFVFILDEYDRSDAADEIHRFVEKLADHLPAQCRLLINSRTLPRLPWIAMIARGQAAMLLDDSIIQKNFYGDQEGDSYDLEVFALGPGSVLHKGEPISSWEGHLPRLLFFFALDRPIVTRSEICGAFWPNLESDQAVNVFHVTKRRLHKALGIDVLVHEESHYRVNPELVVYYDVMDFVETLMIGRNENNAEEKRFEAWQRAAHLYRGPFLQGHTDEWIEERRVAFRAGYLEALSEMAQVWINRDRKELALNLYRQALDEDYHQEGFHRNIMQLYTDLGRRGEAVAHYQTMEKTYREEGKQITPETASIYTTLTESQ